MVSPCSFPDSSPSYGILNLADVADVLLANSIPQMLPMMHLKILNLYESLLLLLLLLLYLLMRFCILFSVPVLL